MTKNKGVGPGNGFTRPNTFNLTKAEQEIYDLFQSGKKIKEIAAVRGVTADSISQRLKIIREKLAASENDGTFLNRRA